MQGYLFATALDQRCRHAIQQCVDSADHKSMQQLQNAETIVRSLNTVAQLHKLFTGAADHEAALFGDRPATPLSTDRGRWLAVISFVRALGVTYLRQMQAFHTQLLWCKEYWKWARQHPHRTQWHLMWTHRSAWRGLWSLNALLFQRNREASEHVLWLAVVDAVVTENIGAVHSALQWMCAALKSAADDNVSDEVRRMHTPHKQKERATGNTSLSSFDEDSRREAHATMDSVLGSLALQTLSKMIPCNPEKLPETTMNMIMNLPSDMRGEGTGGGHVERSDSSTFGHLFHVRSALAFEETPTTQGVIRALKKVSDIAQDWTDQLLMTAVNKHSPPAGRHWLPLLSTVVVVVPLSKFLLTASWSDISSMANALQQFTRQFAATYVVQPCRDLFNSLFAPRVGVKEHAASLQRETESMARIVRDFHRDVDYDLSKADLEGIYERALHANDMGIINKWFEDAIRHPILSLFFGSIVRLMLIQFEQQKLQLSRVLYQSDEVLQSNDFNFKVMALSPVAGLLALILWTVVARRQRRLRPVVRKLRMCWRNLHYLVCHTQGSGKEAGPELQGGVLLYVHEMRMLVDSLRSQYDLHEELLHDLDDIEDMEATQQQRLLALERVMLVHFSLFEKQQQVT